jgi:WD40 repeat protein
LFCGLRSGHLQLLDCRDRSYITEFSPLKGVNYSIVDLFPLSFNGIGNQVITVGSDGTVLRLDLRKRGIHFPILGHTADIQTPNFGTYLSGDESVLALAGKEGCVRFWDPIDGQLLIDPKTIQFPNLVKSLYSLDSKDFGKWMFLQDNLIQEYSSYKMPPIIP